MGIEGLSPSASLLFSGIMLDAIFGDPRYSLHPIRLMGRTLTAYEKFLRRCRLDGYAGGCFLFALLGVTWIGIPSAVVALLFRLTPVAALVVHVFLVFSLMALRDLIDHVRAVENAVRRKDLVAARQAIAQLVGRDIDRMDLAACRRAAIESLSENFVDGYLSAIFWYVLLGLPGLLLFKVASTMDSMVGYKTPLYFRFGWCGARLDDLMNYVPARLAWLMLGLCAVPFASLSARKAWRIGWEQHAVIPGPNPGWSEATMAGALQRRLIGPIWKDGNFVTDVWIGDPTDPEGGTANDDLTRAILLTVTTSSIVLLCAVISLLLG
ncbi:MAG TPA: adenosylcobinamide-phosphate synthase CbiB [Terriglobia bacterium]|nr:adenosylcobinamide-phosphate synthase CbiB [Terriglobia bacterium]